LQFTIDFSLDLFKVRIRCSKVVTDLNGYEQGKKNIALVPHFDQFNSSQKAQPIKVHTAPLPIIRFIQIQSSIVRKGRTTCQGSKEMPMLIGPGPGTCRPYVKSIESVKIL